MWEYMKKLPLLYKIASIIIAIIVAGSFALTWTKALASDVKQNKIDIMRMKYQGMRDAAEVNLKDTFQEYSCKFLPNGIDFKCDRTLPFGKTLTLQRQIKQIQDIDGILGELDAREMRKLMQSD